MRHEVVHVTAELAAEWLSKPFDRQRRIWRTTVIKYAKAMAEGRWQEPTIDPIAFTPAGLLLNGQHRLTALIRTGVELDMLIAYDVNPALFDVIDTARKRSADQFVTQQGATIITGAARVILWYRRESRLPRMTQPSGSALQFDNDELLPLIDSIGSQFEAAAQEARRAYNGSGLPATVHTALLILAADMGADEARVSAWLYGLTEGIGLGLDDPRRRLRERMGDAVNGRNLRRHNAAVWMLMVRAFNAWMQGRPVKTLKYEAADPPPLIDLVGSSASRVRRTRAGNVTTRPGVVTEMAASGER